MNLSRFFLFLPVLLTAGPAAASAISLLPAFTANPSLYEGTYATIGVAALDTTRADNIFRFVVIQFDVSTLTLGTPKILTVYDGSTSSSVTASVSALQAPVPDTDGGADGDFADILGPADTQDYPAMQAAAAERRQWFNTNVSGQTTVATLSFAANNSPTAPPPTSVDVTAIVDAWISGTQPNYGFALYSPSRGIGVNTTSRFFPELTPTLTQVPETGSAALTLLAGATTLAVRRRRPGQPSGSR